MSLFATIEQLEERRNSRVVLLASAQLDLELLGPLYDALREIRPCRDLDLLFYSRGGVVNAARRIALLLREFAERVHFIVPHYCESAGTITALSANQIIAGPLAIFSPVDPLLSASATSSEHGPHALSAQDLRLFHQMSSDWFGVEPKQARAQALEVLCDNIHPSSLTAFYRSTLEVRGICEQLLALHLVDAARNSRIADTLLSGFHSHSYALTREDLRELGLPIAVDPVIEELTWPVARDLRALIGPAARESTTDEWTDALIATRANARRRRRSELFPGRWESWSPS